MTLTDHRRALHQIPELDRDLPQTKAYIAAALAPYRCRVFPAGETGLCGYFDFGRDTAIAFRADMDALPIEEKTNAPYCSRHPGRMHACGHDGHTAILLELARRLNEKQTLPHNVLLVFQSAEETTGGARQVCLSGVFDQYRVEAIFGLHLWPGLPAGVIASRKGELMARSCEVDVEILGKSAHIAKAHEGIDSLEAAVEFYRKAMEMERNLPDSVFRLLKFGKMESGTVRNALSARTVLAGSLRAFQDEIFLGMQAGLRQIAREVEERFHCTVNLAMNEGYPAVMNPPQLYDKVLRTLPFRQLESPAMTAEDFSWYQQFLPGMFFFLGVGDTPALHAANFDFDEAVLENGVSFFEELGEKFQ